MIDGGLYDDKHGSGREFDARAEAKPFVEALRGIAEPEWRNPMARDTALAYAPLGGAGCAMFLKRARAEGWISMRYHDAESAWLYWINAYEQEALLPHPTEDVRAAFIAAFNERFK